MSSGALTIAASLAGVALGVVLTLVALAGRARRLQAGLRSFRCRLGPPPARRPWRRARWCLRRTRAAWADGVLLVRTGALRSLLTPLPASSLDGVEVRALQPGEVRGLGRHPVLLRFTRAAGGTVEIAAAAEDAEQLVGPFLVASASASSRARDGGSG